MHCVPTNAACICCLQLVCNLPGLLQVEDVQFEQAPTIADCFPNSEKVHRIAQHENGPLEVPFRRIHLSGGAGHLDVQDTSGAQVSIKTF